MIKATVNQENTHIITQEKQQTLVNGQSFLWDLINIHTHHFHIVHQYQSYDIEVVETDYVKKKFTLKINSTEYTIDLQDELDLLIKKLGIEEKKDAGKQIIQAPMPGLILNVHVIAGDEVKEEEALLTLEAMKMENVIKASKAGQVKTIKVQQGESVKKDQVLIEML